MWCSPSPFSASHAASGWAGSSGSHELQVGVAEVEIGQPHRHLRRLVHGDHLQAEMVAEVAQRRLGVGDGHGHMVEPADHRGSAVAATRGPIAATTSARRSGPPTFPGTTT